MTPEHGYGNHAQYLKKLKMGVEVRMQASALQKGAGIRMQMLALENKKAKGQVVTEVESYGDLDEVAFWQQGDKALSTEENLKARLAIKYNEEVREVLHVWYALVQKANFCTPSSLDELAPMLTYAGYKAVFVRIHKMLIEDFTEGEAIETINEDWLNDLRDAPGLAQESFFDSMFELADVYEALRSHRCPIPRRLSTHILTSTFWQVDARHQCDTVCRVPLGVTIWYLRRQRPQTARRHRV